MTIETIIFSVLGTLLTICGFLIVFIIKNASEQMKTMSVSLDSVKLSVDALNKTVAVEIEKASNLKNDFDKQNVRIDKLEQHIIKIEMLMAANQCNKNICL